MKTAIGIWRCSLDEAGKPIYTRLASGGTPQFLFKDSILYVAIAEGATEANITNPAYWLPVPAVFPSGSTSAGYGSNGSLDNVVDDGSGIITFEFVDNAGVRHTMKVPKYYDNPSITFQNNGSNITSLNIGKNSEADITFSITNVSYITGAMAEVFVVCEGGWTSELSDVSTYSSQVTGNIKLKLTAPYRDAMTSNMTLYLSYYGKTVMKQLKLQAEGTTVEAMSVAYDATTASFSFATDMLDGDQTPTIKFAYDGDTRWMTLPEDSFIDTGETVEAEGKTLKKYTQKVDFYRNTGDIRGGYVIVYAPSGREIYRRRIEQKANPSDLRPINLANPTGDYPDPANCYIITNPGTYMIPTYKGNDTNTLISGSYYTNSYGKPYVWSDNQSTIEFQENTSPNELVFTVGSVKPGNTVIAITDDSGILWSWHLWFCPDNDPTQSHDTYGNVNIMNRNLGAQSPTGNNSEGTYYQWGRKDPLRVGHFSVDSGAGTDAANANPSVLYSDWSSSNGGWDSAKKSVNDPCPPGYKIPAGYEWSDVPKEQINFPSRYEYLKIQDGEYPFHGYLSASDGTQVTNSVHKSKNETHFFNYEVPLGFYSWEIPLEITYYYNIYEEYGDLWCATEARKYYYSHIINQDPELVTYTPDLDGLGIPDRYKDRVANALSQNVPSLAQKELDNKFPQHSSYTQSLMSESPANGLQVRCVKE